MGMGGKIFPWYQQVWRRYLRRIFGDGNKMYGNIMLTVVKFLVYACPYIRYINYKSVYSVKFLLSPQNYLMFKIFKGK